MASFNPYLVDEIVAETEPRQSYFGLIEQTTAQTELHGYEVTMSGRIVTPELNPYSLNAQESERETGRIGYSKE